MMHLNFSDIFTFSFTDEFYFPSNLDSSSQPHISITTTMTAKVINGLVLVDVVGIKHNMPHGTPQHDFLLDDLNYLKVDDDFTIDGVECITYRPERHLYRFNDMGFGFYDEMIAPDNMVKWGKENSSFSVKMDDNSSVPLDIYTALYGIKTDGTYHGAIDDRPIEVKTITKVFHDVVN